MKNNKYLTNKSLLEELEKCQRTGVMSNELGRMFILLVDKIATKGNFYGYSYLDDMKGNALVVLCRAWERFDPKKSDNPFSFFTQCIINEFKSTLNKEKSVQVLRDEMLVEVGQSPSYTYKNGSTSDDNHI